MTRPASLVVTLPLAAILLLAACGDDGPTHEEATAPLVVSPDLPPVDRATAAVPLSEVVFDTFDGGSLRLDRADGDDVAGLLDAIPPIDEPVYEPAVSATWLEPDDLVVGYEAADGTTWAWPTRILDLHELINTTIDDVPLLVTYCPLCRSGVLYDRRLDGEELTFGNTSALYQNDLVMYDHQTNSYWWQVAGTAIVGTRSGESLTVLPSRLQTWDAWTAEHPDTVVLTTDTGHSRDYERDRFASYPGAVARGDVPFPVDNEVFDDDRLDPSTLVAVVRSADGTVVAHPVDPAAPWPAELAVEPDVRTMFWFAALTAHPDIQLAP